MEHFDIICNSPSEIYYHALPFSPSSSWLHKYYSPELLQGVKVITGLQTNWGICSRTVSVYDNPQALVCWKDLIAVGLWSGEIIILDAITGIHASVLSGHVGWVKSVAFSFDGASLVSGSFDNTIKLWDIQTGGVAKTFYGHTDFVWSVSISPDYTMIASGSLDYTIRLWDAQTGGCCCVIDGHSDSINSVSFSPTNSQLLISASDDDTVQQWDINGHQIGPTYRGNHAVFSPDGACFVSWRWEEKVVIVWDSGSGEAVAELQSPSNGIECCCFSPDGKFVAGGIGHTVYIWDITNSNLCPIKTLTGHTRDITSLTFSSSLISSSLDKSIKFWQTCALVATNSESTQLASAEIESVSLQATNGIAISSDSAGVVKTWDILTGICKASFQTPAGDNVWRDTQLIEGRITCVWLDNDEYGKIHIWDTEKGECLQTLGTQYTSSVRDLRISGDRSEVFLLSEKYIQAWSIWTGEAVCEVKLDGKPLYNSLIIDGSRVWVLLKGLQVQGWDFGFPGSTPVPLPNTPLNKPHLCFIGTEYQNTSPSRVEDMVTGKEVFQLSGRYANPLVARWDGQYLITGYESGEMLILDLNCMIPR